MIVERIAVCLVLFQTGVALAQEADRTPQVLHYEGSDIPDYIAWQSYFRKADLVYRLGAGYFIQFIDQRLKIGEALKGRPALADQVLEIIADYGTLCHREDERTVNQIATSNRLLKAGDITLAAHLVTEIELTRAQVRFLRGEKKRFHQAILESDPVLGAEMWSRIEEYVLNGVKATINITREVTPRDDALWKTIKAFDREEKK